MKTLYLFKQGGAFVVDDPFVPGSPPVGRGRTMKEAIGDWFINNQDTVGYAIDTAAVRPVEIARIKRELSKR